MNLIRSLVAAVFVTSLLFVLSSCDSVPSEQAIENSIVAIEQAIENKNSGDVLEHLSDYLVVNDRLGKQDIKRLLLVQFLRHKNISVVVSGIDITLHPNDPKRAQSEVSVVLVGAVGLIPDSGRVYRVKSQWQMQGSDWLLTTVTWE